MRVHSNGDERRASIIVVGRTVNYGGPFENHEPARASTRIRSNFSPTPRAADCATSPCLPALWLGKLRGMDGIDAWKHTEVSANPRMARRCTLKWTASPVGSLPLKFRIVPDALSL